MRPKAAALMLATVLAGCVPGEPRPVIWWVDSPYAERVGAPRPADLAESLQALQEANWIRVPARNFAQRLALHWSLGTPPDLVLSANWSPIGSARRHAPSWSDSLMVVGLPEGLPSSVFLRRDSRHYPELRALMLEVTSAHAGSQLPDVALDDAIRRIATAVMTRDLTELSRLRDPDALATRSPPRPAADVLGIELVARWGNSRLAFTQVRVQADGDDWLGTEQLLLVLRRDDTQSPWRYLVATQDPASQRLRPSDLGLLRDGLDSSQVPPEAATLLSPPSGTLVPPGLPFRDFKWQASGGPRTVELAEFAYHGEARLIATTRAPGVHRVSSGRLWTTRDEWSWRIWTIDESGRIAFSAVRQFVH